MGAPMIDSETWASIEQGAPSGHAGTAVRRVAPASGHDLFVGVRFPVKHRQLVLEVSSLEWPVETHLPEFKSLHTSVEETSGVVRAVVELGDPALNDVFTALANDVVQHVSRAHGGSEGVTALVERLGRWRRLLEPEAGGGMTKEERRGLFGELLILKSALSNGAPPALAVFSWVGPTGANQDFQFPHLGIEVKTTAARQPQALKISSERQLDDTGMARLLLAHVSLDERNQGTGISLPKMIDAVRSEVGVEMAAQLNGLLVASGWVPGSESRYSLPLYTVRSVVAFEVREGFPRITEADCPPGVGDVTYRVQLGALTDFTSNFDMALANVAGQA